MMKWVKLKESTKSINTARVIIHSLLTSIFFYLLFAGTSIAAQQAPTIELEEIRSDEEFYAWLNSEAPIQWLERYFPESRSWLREANTIIDFYSRAIRLFTMKHIPNPPTVYSVCYPIIGSDFVTPFLFGASNCLSCDAAPLLKSKKSLEADIFNIFKPFIPAIESSEKECLHLFLALLGFNHPYVPREDFSSPTGYLAMFRLKLLLQAEDIQVTSLSKEQFKITFSKPEIYGRYSLIYFNQTNILGTSENDRERAGNFYQHLSKQYYAIVLLKRSDDFGKCAKRFWKSIGKKSVVYTDEPIKTHPGFLSYFFSPHPLAQMKLSHLMDELKEQVRDIHPEFKFAAESFGYDHKIILYASEQF